MEVALVKKNSKNNRKRWFRYKKAAERFDPKKFTLRQVTFFHTLLAARIVGCRQFHPIWGVKSFITKKNNFIA